MRPVTAAVRAVPVLFQVVQAVVVSAIQYSYLVARVLAAHVSVTLVLCFVALFAGDDFANASGGTLTVNDL